MTPEMIAAIVGIAVSLGLEYIPGFKDIYNSWANKYQKLFAIGVGLLVVYGAFGLGCGKFLVPFWPCTGDGAIDALYAFFAYVGANQGFFALVLKKDK